MNLNDIYLNSVTLLTRAEPYKKRLSIIAAATALLYAYLSTKNSTKKYKNQKEIPTPRFSYPIVGHLLSLGDEPDRTIATWHNDLGPILKLQFGVLKWISISEPKLAHKLLASLGSKSSYRFQPSFLGSHYSMNGKGLVFAQPDGSWKDSRAVALSLLSPKEIYKYTDLIYKESSIFVDTVLDASLKNDGIVPFDYLDFYALNTVTNITFGKRFQSQQNTEYRTLCRIAKNVVLFGSVTYNLHDYLPAVSIVQYFYGTQSKMKKFIETERDPIFKKLIDDASETEGINMVKTLDGKSFDLSDEEKVALISDIVIAGVDNISVVLSWNIIIMCHYPEVQKMASAEIDSFIRLNGRIPLFKERLQLPYCISVMKECMRFRPNSPFGGPRAVREDVELDGYLIPKGTIIVANLYGINHDPEFYHNPDKFIPERFMGNPSTMQAALNGNVENRDHFSFGWGRRKCPGAHLSEIEIFSTFISVLAKCFIVPTDEGMPDMDRVTQVGFSNWPRKFKVKFTKRPDALI
ncbi:cytochrome P450 [Helicostylum pulchrum]|uniref:Cytochrome P450 n=1 Tax=Helicostylum pulchrum TaxID=562976 RepID=A0ABP9XKG0_9FUNG|nr:cytochrome P450 [Helicostylum pulchrum]